MIERREIGVCWLLSTALVGSAAAGVFDNEAGTGDYNTAANWEGDTVPGTVGGEDAVIGRVGSSGGTPFANPAEATLSAAPAGGNPISALRVGDGPGGAGVFDHSAGALVTAPGVSSSIGAGGPPADPSVGIYNLSGTASFTQSGAELRLGAGGGPRNGGAPNQGSLTLTGGAVFNGAAVFVGSDDGNRGLVDQSGGEFNAGVGLTIGREGAALGAYTISAGTLNALGDGITVGAGDGTRGELVLEASATGATVDASNLRVGRGLTPNGAGFGVLSVVGDNHTLRATTLSVGANDGVLTDGVGNLVFSNDTPSGSGGFSPIVVAGDVTLNDGTGAAGGGAFLQLLDFNPLPAGEVLLIDVGGVLAGEFVGLPEGAAAPLIFGGPRTISYTGGDGNDVVLTALPGASLLGDADGDGDVDGDDLIAVQTEFGAISPTPLLGDADDDGDVDGDDLIAVQTEFGEVATAAAVPEPGSAALALLYATGFLRRGRTA